MPDNTPEFIDPAEDCPLCTPRAILARYGYTPLPPAQLDDRQLPGRLWELLYAAAARRFYFNFTNHLSDRQLYTLLWDKWLDKLTPDIPLEAETNTRVDVSGYEVNGMTEEEIWFRYYAEEGDLELLRSEEPDFVAPPRLELPFDRDRFLPVPPYPLEAHAGWLPGDDLPEEDEEEESGDPLGLAAVDEEIALMNGESVPELEQPDPALEAHLAACEPENWTPPADKLVEEKVPLLPPDEITDETLAPILWELLHNLALRGFYVSHTDHLSDREVYSALWHQGLREPASLPGRNPRGGWFHDFLGSWGEDDLRIWLRYYATDEERAKHQAEWPEDVLPPKEQLPCNRDWRLPKGPF